jgi:hypothetical protein
LKISEARRFALSLPGVTEQPHFDLSSFRIKGRIFATLPPDEVHLHVFVDEEDRDPMVAADPAAYERLWWGKKVVGLRVTLQRARPADVRDLLYSAWRRKAPASLVRSVESQRHKLPNR